MPHWRLDFVYRNGLGSRGATVSPLRGGPSFTIGGVPPDPTSMEAGFGLQFVLPDELTFWLDYDENFLERFFARSRLTVGVRKQF